jgi:hypothetical protein
LELIAKQRDYSTGISISYYHRKGVFLSDLSPDERRTILTLYQEGYPV